MSGDDGFSAYIGDLIAAGQRIHSLAMTYKSDMANRGLDPADAGAADINGTLETTLRMIGHLHLMIAQAMAVHGEKIQKVGERYTHVNDVVSHNINTVLQQVVNEVRNPTSQPPYVPRNP